MIADKAGMGRKLLMVAVLQVLLAVPTAPARAAEGPYEGGLLRLSELLGSLHFLRTLCGEKGDRWRHEMERLLETEKPEAERRARFVASFNRGYRAFQANYTTCTASATEAINRYMKEGEKLSRGIAAKYGN
jgi:uncharacterized protein (TIGR02301 family)